VALALAVRVATAVVLAVPVAAVLANRVGPEEVPAENPIS
jgi:hypothetical protein